MLETITNLKNNKIKPVAAAASQVDKETLLKMKKFLGNLGKRRMTHSTEALRVSLDDIRNVETKGKYFIYRFSTCPCIFNDMVWVGDLQIIHLTKLFNVC